jgi:hypothetical protein
VKNIPYLLQALIAVLFVTLFAIFDDRVFGVDIVTTAMNIAFACTAYLFVGHAFWSQTIGDMRANFDNIDNQRMLTQLSARSGSMIIPMLTVIIFWFAFALVAAVIATMEDTAKGPLTNFEGFGGW